MTAAPPVSVVVVNYRRADDTIACLRAVRDDLVSPDGGVQVVCVDNSDDPAETAALRTADTGALVVDAGGNLGFAAGCNLGAAHATGEVLAFLNSDARPDPRWLVAALDALRADDTIAAVASKVLDWDGAMIDFAGGALSWFGMGYEPSRGAPDGPRFDVERDVLFATGSATVVRAARFHELGGFDEALFMFYEDVDLGWRLNLAGHRVRYVPSSIARHRHHASVAGSGEFREQYLLERNALMLLYKNLEQPTLDRVLPAALALAARRATARGGLDPLAFEMTRRGDGDTEPTATVPKAALAPLYAIDRFVEALPGLRAARDAVQATRVRTDAHLRPLLGDIGELLVDAAPYASAHALLTREFDVDTAYARPVPRLDVRLARLYAGAGGPAAFARVLLAGARRRRRS